MLHPLDVQAVCAVNVAQEDHRKVALDGVGNLDEGVLLVGGGISPMDAIRIATLNSARFLGKDRDMGSVEEGKIADLVLLSADPLADINNTKKIGSVFKAGQLIDRSKLDLPVNRKTSADDVAPMLMYPIENALE